MQWTNRDARVGRGGRVVVERVCRVGCRFVRESREGVSWAKMLVEMGG
jgi:hypothetical protein